MKCIGSVTLLAAQDTTQIAFIILLPLLEKKITKKFWSVSLHYSSSHMCRLHLASGSMLKICFYDRQDGLFLLWYLFFSCLEFFDVSLTVSVAFF